MGTVLIIVQAPGFDDYSSCLEGTELVDVQALVSQPPIKGFNKGVFDRFARANEVQFDSMPVGPIFQRSRLEFRAMIHRDGARSGAIPYDAIKRLPNLLTGHPKTHLK